MPTTRVIGKEGNYQDIPIPDLAGLRDRAIIAVMIYTFDRVGSMVAMTVEDYYPQGKRSWLRLYESGGKRHEVPARHALAGYLEASIMAAGIAEDRKGLLFSAAPGFGAWLTRNSLSTAAVRRMIRGGIKKPGVRTRAGRHSFPATVITRDLENRDTLEKAQQMASRSSPRTAKPCDRTDDQMTLDEVEKFVI